MRQVVKRDGRRVDFDASKIQDAIHGAFEDEKVCDQKAEDIVFTTVYGKIAGHHMYDTVISVEQIQDIVERALMERGEYNIAKAYIKYRYEHELTRQKKTDEDVLSVIGGKDNYWKTENSNKNATLVTVQRDYLAGILSTDIAKKYIFPKDVIEAHDNGLVHQHDMDYMAQSSLSNCELINLNDMLQNGTVINKVKINKPHRLITAMTITTQIMASVAAQTYGGESINLAHIAPFVKASSDYYWEKYRHTFPDLDNNQIQNLVDADLAKEITDAVQTFNYQISTLFTLNGQAPFCSLFIYLNDTQEYKRELILLAKEFFKQRMDGMPNEEGIPVTQAFPKILYVLEEDNYKPGTKYWELTKLAIQCSSNRLTPDYISEKKMKELKINGHGEGDCFSCMGRRKLQLI